MDELYDLTSDKIIGYIEKSQWSCDVTPASHLATTDTFHQKLGINLIRDNRIFSLGYNVILIRRSSCTKQD